MTDKGKGIEAVEERDRWRKAATRAATDFKFGDVIDKAWLEENLDVHAPESGTRKDFEQYSFKFLSAIHFFQEVLLHKYKMALKNIRHGEYRIVFPAEQADLGLEKAHRSIMKGIETANELIDHTRVDLLSAEEAKHRADAVGKLAALRSMTGHHLSKRFTPGDDPQKK